MGLRGLGGSEGGGHPGLRRLTSITPLSLPSSVISRWRFEDGSDTSTATDSEGANDGTTNGVDFTQDRMEGEMSLEAYGNSEYVEVPDDSSLDITGDVSIGFWAYVKSKPSGWYGYVTKAGTDAGSGYAVYNSNGNIAIRLDGSGNHFSYEIPTGTATHIGISFDSANAEATLWVNGSQQETITGTSDLTTTNNAGLYIGTNSWSTDESIDGYMDDVIVADGYISGSTWQDLYEAGHGELVMSGVDPTVSNVGTEPIWETADYDWSSETPDNPTMLRDPLDGAPTTYNGDYVLAYDDDSFGGGQTGLALSTDLETWTASGWGGVTDHSPNELLDMRNISDASYNFWMFMRGTNANILLKKSDDLQSWTAAEDIANDFVSPEDIAVQQASDGTWYAVYEEDGNTSGVAVRAGTTTNALPDSGWTDQGYAIDYDSGKDFVANPTLISTTDSNGDPVVEMYYEGKDSDGADVMGAWVGEDSFTDNTAWTIEGQLYAATDYNWQAGTAIPNTVVRHPDTGEHYVYYRSGGGDYEQTLGLAAGESMSG